VTRLVATLVLGAALAGCLPTLVAESPAPPGRSARLDEINGFWQVQSYTLELSQGVAIAISCSASKPCSHVELTSDAPEHAEVRTASFDVLRRSGWAGNAATASAFVVVGKAPGTAHLHLKSDEGPRDIAVTVVAPPQVHEARAATARK
jgi:hypothetical protein